jgi:hypothetical protein
LDRKEVFTDMQKRAIALTLILLFGLGLTLAAKGGKKDLIAETSCEQYGAPATSVESGSFFEIRGTGLKTWSPAWVCLKPGLCERTSVDSSGSFVMTRSQETNWTFTYGIEVYQWANRSGRSSELVATGSIRVVAP